MKANKKKLAIFKCSETPSEQDIKILAKAFKGTSYRPVFITTNFNFKQGNLIIG